MTVSEYNNCVDLYADGVYRFVLKHIKDKDDAKDIVQDCFEKMWIKRETIDGNKSKTYLFTSAYHGLVDFTRKRKRLQRMEDAHTQQYLYYDNNNNLKEVLDSALEKLPDIQKSVILLRDYEGYDYNEIGKITDLSESQVKVYIFRARQFLKEYLGKIENLV